MEAADGQQRIASVSGQGTLLRIAMTCAAIAIGSAVVGSQLATTGTPSRIASSVSDEEDDLAEEGGYAGQGEGSDPVEDEPGDEAEARDEDVAEDASEDAAEDASEDAVEDVAEEAAEEAFEEAPQDVAEDEAGTTEEESSGATDDETGDGADDESSATPERAPEDEGGIAVVRRRP
jgi:hypothetical protein